MPVFVQFDRPIGHYQNHIHFVGRSLEDVVADASLKGWGPHVGHREVTEEVVRQKANGKTVDEGIRAVVHDGCLSFYIGQA